MASRKRRAPVAPPQIPQQPTAFPQETDPFHGWNDASMTPGDLGSAFTTDSMFDFPGTLGVTSGNPASHHNRIVSLDRLDGEAINGDAKSYTGQLVRRNPNQQLTARSRGPWDSFGNPSQGPWPPEGAEDNDEDLEQRALIARKDAQAKRKQIPPFVQKLSSFLDNNKNTNLIRWSDDGNSFIVLDEDEFARTLIPELFKHNNYASFVRQLNMYGFHKKVGLSDNSMKASEAKAKAPSEYYNKYFKRGRSELLWLIQKPKNTPGNPKRKRDEDGKQIDSDDDRKYVADPGGGVANGGGYVEENIAIRGNTDMVVIPRSEYNSLRNDVHTLQQQQKVISSVLSQIRSQNNSLYQQALGFQTLHDRHENSINAILTFLATFYNRSLENNNGGGNLSDLFGSSMPQQQPHGSVVDVGDYQDGSLNKSPQLSRQSRRPLALLPAPFVREALGVDRAATVSPSVRSPTSPVMKQNGKPAAFTRSPVTQTRNLHGDPYVSAPTPMKVDNTRTPPQNLAPLPENDEILSAIQNANANAGHATTQSAQFDFPAALANYEAQGGNVPLTAQQRNEVLSIMANNASVASPNSALAQNSNNAVASPQPPTIPDLSQFQASQSSLDLLHRMAEEQNTRVQSLQERLQPLSPSGTIPGLEDGYFSNAGVGEPGQFDLDLDSFIPNEDYLTQNGHNGDVPTVDLNLPDLNYNMDNHAMDLNGAGFTGDTVEADLLGFDTGTDSRVESLSSSSTASTSPTVTVEDVDEKPKRSPKRRRK